MDTVRVPASPSCGLSTQGRRSQTLSCGTFLWPQERAGPGAVIGGHTVLCTRENSLRLTLETHAPGAAFKENLTPQRHATGYSVSFAIRGRRTKSRRAPAPRPSGQLKRKTVTAAAAARTREHRTARTRRAGVRSGSVAPERGTADEEPPRHPAAQSRAAVPEPRKHMFVRRRKKKKRYTSIHNSSAQNSKILEPKRPPTMPWLNRLWRSRIGEHSSATKRKTWPLHAATRTGLEGRLREVPPDLIHATFSKQDDHRWRADRRFFSQGQEWRGRKSPRTAFGYGEVWVLVKLVGP